MSSGHSKDKHKHKHPHGTKPGTKADGEPVPMVKQRASLATILAACLLLFGLALAGAFVLWYFFA